MKRCFPVIVLLVGCAAVCVAVDGRAQRILAELSAKIDGLGSYMAGFTASAEGSSFGGEYRVSGDKYYIKLEDAEVICDGKVRYEISHLSREVVMDRVPAGDNTVFSNPSRAFDFADANFTSEYMGTRDENGKSCDVVRLMPKDKGGTLTDVEIAVDRATGLPVVIRYGTEAVAEKIEITVRNIRSADNPDKEYFSFDRQKFKDYELIDFR